MPPLENSSIFTTDCNQEFVIVTKATFCHVNAMAHISTVIPSTNVARISEKTNNAVFISRSDGPSITSSRTTVHIGAVTVLWPNTLHGPSRYACPGCPSNVFQSRRKLNQFTRWNFPKQKFKILRIALQVFTVLAPIYVCHRRTVALTHTCSLEIARGVIYVYEKVVARHR